MNIIAEINLNGEGFIDGYGRLTSHISGHKPITAAEAIQRAEYARKQSAQWIEAAENMERLAESVIFS